MTDTMKVQLRSKTSNLNTFVRDAEIPRSATWPTIITRLGRRFRFDSAPDGHGLYFEENDLVVDVSPAVETVAVATVVNQ